MHLPGSDLWIWKERVTSSLCAFFLPVPCLVLLICGVTWENTGKETKAIKYVASTFTCWGGFDDSGSVSLLENRRLQSSHMRTDWEVWAPVPSTRLPGPGLRQGAHRARVPGLAWSNMWDEQPQKRHQGPRARLLHESLLFKGFLLWLFWISFLCCAF